MSEIEQLKQAWDKFLDDIANEWHLYEILDWIDERINRWKRLIF